MSSIDPNKVSMTVKGVLLGVVPGVMFLVGIANIDLGQDQLTSIIDAIVLVIQYGLTLVSAVVTLYGLVRKLILTIKGENKALKP